MVAQITVNYRSVAYVFTIKSDYRLSEAGHDIIIEWARNILSEGKMLKENFYAVESIMKPLGLGYQKINMCPNFCMLYYLENVELIECRKCGHSHYKLRTSRERTLIEHKKIRYFSIIPRLQKLFMSPKTDNIFILQVTTLGYEPSLVKLFVKMHVRSDDHKKGVQQFMDSQSQHFMIYWFSTIFFLSYYLLEFDEFIFYF